MFYTPINSRNKKSHSILFPILCVLLLLIISSSGCISFNIAKQTNVPSAPQNLTAKIGNNSITLTWIAPLKDGGSRIVSYNIYRNDTIFTHIDNITIYRDQYLINNISYEYQVSASNKHGESPKSKPVTATPMPVPSSPGLIYAVAENGRVELVWFILDSTINIPIMKYNIYRGSSTNNETLLTVLNQFDLYLVNYNDTNVTNGQSYYYMVSVTNKFGEGPRSNELNATPSDMILEPVWYKTYNNNTYWSEETKDIAVDSSGVYVLGTIYNNTDSFAILLKYDLKGNLLWDRMWGNVSEGYGIAIDSYAIYVTGVTLSNTTNNGDAFLIKYNLNGNLIWNRTWGGNKIDNANCIAIDSTSIYIAGISYNYNGIGKVIDVNSFLVKYNPNGNFLWNLSWENNGSPWVSDIAVDHSGIYITGYANVSGKADYDAFLLKYNLNGYLLWNFSWGGPGNDSASAIALDKNSIYVTGMTGSYSTDFNNLFLNKYDLDGILLWSRLWGDPGDAVAFDVSFDSSSIYVAGSTADSANYYKAVVIKYDLNGDLIWNRTWSGMDFNPEWVFTTASAICVDDHSIYITGKECGYFMFTLVFGK